MSAGAKFFLKKALGEDFFQSLEKFELYKPGTRTVIDHEEVKTALKIVPRVIMSLLVRELTPMLIGETKRIDLEIHQSNPPDGILEVTKHERDVYSGHIESSTEKYTDKVVAEFKYRPLPGVGLIIMSTFEMYDIDDLEKESSGVSPEIESKIQSVIDERMALHDLISKVVHKKIDQRDAIQQLILAKLGGSPQKERRPETKVKINVDVSPTIKVENKQQQIRIKKESPLKDFLEKRKQKFQKTEHAVEMMKGEQVNCPDCHQNIFNGEVFSGCVCLGDDMDKKIYLTKAEKGLKVRFGKGWDPENIEMLLEVMRRKRG